MNPIINQLAALIDSEGKDILSAEKLVLLSGLSRGGFFRDCALIPDELLPEKALCDELYKSRPAKNKGDLKTLLFDEIGVGKRKINRLDVDLIFELADCYGCKNLHLLKMLLRKKHESDH